MWAGPDGPISRFLMHLRRAAQLTCPECGIAPIFKPLKQVRGLDDWLRPLHGCPRCRYRYEREQGYFLVAIWVINYSIVAGLGLFLAFTFGHLYDLTLRQQILYFIAPMPILSMLVARHAKAFFLAIDHFYEPQRWDSLANRRVEPADAAVSPAPK